MTRDTPFDSAVSRRELLKRATVASAAGLTGVSAFSTSAAAQNCDAVVPDDYATIQDAVDDASSGDTICVRPGTYTEEVSVDEEVTLHGQTPPGSGNPVVLDGRVSVDAGADGTTVRRLRIAPSETFEGGTFPDPFGVRVQASDVVVENNVVEGLHADLSNGEGSFALHGVQVFGPEGADVSDVTVRDNVIRGFESEGDPTTWPKFGGIAGVKVQAGVDGATISDNEISDHHSAGWAYGVVLTTSGSAPGVPTDVTVEDNRVSAVNDSSVYDVFDGANEGRDSAPYPGSAFGIDGDADADEATVRYNNLLAPNGAESKDGDATLVAECNWWADRSGPTHDDNPDGTGTWALERGDATIDYTPWLGAPSPSRACVGGEDSGDGDGNGNGNANARGR